MAGSAHARGILCALLVFVLGTGAAADGPSPDTLAKTLRYDPDSPAVPDILAHLSSDGPKAWKALAAIVQESEGDEAGLDVRAAEALLGGPERRRYELAGQVYDQVNRAGLCSLLALGLARVYPAGADRLHAHLRADREGSVDLLRALGTRGLPKTEIEALLAHEDLAPLARELLAGRTTTQRVVDLLPRARDVAGLGLDPVATRAFLEEFEGDPYRPLLEAVCEVLRDADPVVRLGAHCILLTASGMNIAPDADLWHAWLAGETEGYAVPDPVSEGAIAAAVRRGAHFLLMDLEPDGACRHAFSNAGDSITGATSLAVLALRHAGVPADDPALRRAVETTLLLRDAAGRPGLRPFSRRYETYSLSLLAMALHAVGDEDRGDVLPAVRDRLSHGVLANGQWTYACLSPTEGAKPATGDNSNTQYANLGLRALRASGVPVDPALWSLIDAFWRDHQQPDGAWGYVLSGRDARRGPVQMTASGIAGLAIAREGLEGRSAATAIAQDAAVQRGLQALGRRLLLTDAKGITPYSWYAVERACVLTGTRAFGAFGHLYDWYREGAWHFLQTQQAGGAWGVTSVKDWPSQGFGQATSTAYALLFLTRATATIGDTAGDGLVVAPLTDADLATTPARSAPAASAVALRRPWAGAVAVEPELALRLSAPSLATRDGKVTIRGLVEGPWATVEVAGRTAAPDEEGWFEVQREVRATGTVEVVATDVRGRAVRATVHVTFDQEAPSIRLVGSPLRAAAPQRLELESDEPLDGVEVGGHYFPAHGTHVHVTADLDDKTLVLPVAAFDRAGNRTRERIPLDVTNRVLSLDGGASIRVALEGKPTVFTAECWARIDETNREQGVFGDTEGAGFGLFLLPKDGPQAWAYVHDGHDYAKAKWDRALKTGRWTHLAMTYDGSAVRLFVDGRLRAEAEAPAYKRCSRSLYLGATPDSHNRQSNPLRGAIDEFRLSDVVRYERSFRPAYAHLPDRHTLVLYHFDTDTDAAILDASGRQHNGTPAGTPQLIEEKR